MDFDKLEQKMVESNLYKKNSADIMLECIELLYDSGLNSLEIAQTLREASVHYLQYGEDEHSEIALKIYGESLIEYGKEIQAYQRRRKLQVHTNTHHTSGDEAAT